MGCYPRREIQFLRKLPSAAICGVESCLRLTEFLDRRLHVLTEARAERARRRPGERGAGRATKQFLSPDFRQGRAKTPNAQLIGDNFLFWCLRPRRLSSSNSDLHGSSAPFLVDMVMTDFRGLSEGSTSLSHSIATHFAHPGRPDGDGYHDVDGGGGADYARRPVSGSSRRSQGRRL